MRLFGANSDTHAKLQNEYWECYVGLHRFIQSTTSLVAKLLKKAQPYKHIELQELKFKLIDTLHQLQSLMQKLLEIQHNVTRFDREYCSLDLFLSSNSRRQRWLITPRSTQNTPVGNGSSHREEETTSWGTLVDALDLTGNGRPKRISLKKINCGLDATAGSLNKRYSAPLGCAEVQQALASRFVHFQNDLRRHLCVAWNLLSGFAWLAVASALIKCKFRKGILHKHHLNESNPNQTKFLENLIEYMTSESVQFLARQLTMWRLVQDPCPAERSRTEDGMIHQLQMIFTRLRTMNGTGKDAPMDDMAGMYHVLFEIQNLFHDIQTHRQRYTNISLVAGSWQLGHSNFITSSNAVTLKVFVRQLNAHCIALNAAGVPLKPGYKRSQIVLYCSRPFVSVWPSINSTTCCSKTQKSTLAIEERVYERRIPVCGKKPQQAFESVNDINDAGTCVYKFDRENGDVHFEEANSMTADRVVTRFVCPSTTAKYTQVSISVRPKQSSYYHHKISNDSITPSYTSEITMFLTASHKIFSGEQTRQDISASPGDCSLSQISLVTHSELNEPWASPLLHDSIVSDYLGVLSPLPTPEQFANVESTEWSIQGKAMEREQCTVSNCTDVSVQNNVLKTDCVQRSTLSRDLESSRLSVLDPIPECDSQANSDAKSSARGTEMTNSEHPTVETEGHVFDDLVTATIENEMNELLVKTEELEQAVEWVAAQLCKINGCTTSDLMADSTRIPLHLAFIDQANETLAPLGGRIRQMLRQINQIEQSPVCCVQTKETALVQNRVKQNAVDVNLLSELRTRLKRIRKERSAKLHECEQLIIQLQQAQTLHGEISANLHSIQAELARCSKLIDNHEDAPTRIRWSPDHGLKDQLDRFHRIATDLTERVAPRLAELSKSTKEFQFDQLDHQISDATAELEELVCIVCRKKECLESLDGYLDQLNLRAKDKLASLQNELTNLKRNSFEANGQTTPEHLAILTEGVYNKCTRLQDLQSEIHPVLTQLFEVTQTADSNKILLRHNVEGNLEGVNCFVQLKMDITKCWTQLTDELEEQLKHLLDVVSEMVNFTCSKVVMFGPARQIEMLLHSSELLKPEQLQLQLATIEQQINELNSHSDWIKQYIDPLLYDKSSTLLFDDDKLQKRDELLSRLDEANTQLHILRDELQTVYSPAVVALNERIQKALPFLKLLYLQFQELPKPLVKFDELDVSVSELSVASQLELLNVQQSQCQQLLEAVQNEQHCFTEDITHIWQANGLGPEQLNSLTDISADGMQSAVDDDTAELVLGSIIDMGPEVTLKCLLQAYSHLGQKVTDRLAQFHSYITELSQKRCLVDESESIASVDETDAQLTYFEVSESDSGLPAELSLTLVDTMAQLTLDGVNEIYSHLDIDEVESELQDLVGGVEVSADVEKSSAGILPEGTEAKCEKQTVGAAGDTIVNEQVWWTPTSALPASTSQWLHSEEVQLSQSEAKLNELKIRYHQVVHSVLASLQENDYSSVARLSEYFKATLTLIKEISGELSLLTRIEGSNYQMTSALVGDDETVQKNILHLTLKPDVIPLWYRIEGLEIHTKYFVDAVNECERLTLMAYELSERVSSMIARLGPWLEDQSRILDEVSQVGQCSSNPDELLSALGTLSTTKLMIRSKAGAVGQVIHDVLLLRQTLGQFNAKINFERHLISWDAHYQDQSTPPKIEVNSDGLNLPLYAHLDRLDAAYTNLVKMCADSTRTVCTRLFEIGRADLVLRDIEQNVNDYGASALENHSNDEKKISNATIPTISTDISAVTEWFSGIVSRKQLEVYVSELTTYQTLMDQAASVQNQGQVPIACDTILNPLWQSVYNRLLINLNTSSNSLLKSKCEFAQIRKIDSFMFSNASWLRRNGLRLFKWTHPKGLSLATASAKLCDFQEVCTKIEQEIQTKSEQMMGNIREWIMLPVSSDKVIKKFLTYLEVVLLGNNSCNDQPDALDDLSAPGLRLFVHEQHRYKRFVSFLQLTWDCHVKFVAQYEEKIHKLSTVFQALHATLAKLYRPSKLVAQCNEQLMEINDAISDLQAHATTVGHMYSAVPQLRRFCQPLEVSKMLTTIRSMKHEFLCLSSRAEERKKILQQALKEDIVFDTAYKNLMSTLKEYCEEKSSNSPTRPNLKDAQSSEPQSSWDLQRESANYWAVLRLGCYLRDRCTQSDPERGIIDNMLTDLRHLWYACFRKQAERSLACEKALLDQGAHSAACEKLSEWIRTFESTLKISAPVSDILSVFNVDILGPDIIKLMPFKWTTTSKTTNIQLTCVKDDSRLRECGFSTSDLQSLVSVYGDTALVHSIQDELRLLSEELDKRMHLWNAGEPVPINDDSRRDLPLHLRTRMIRLRVALDLRSQALETAMDAATAIQQAWLTLSNWLCELEARIKWTRCQPNSINSSVHRTAGLAQSQLDIYEYARFTRTHVTAPILSCYNSVMKHLLTMNGKEKSSADTWIMGRCHTRVKPAMRRQFHSLISKWKQMDQHLKVLQMSLNQGGRVPQCVWDFETLECTIEKMTKDTRRELGRDQLVSKKLTEALLQPDDAKLSNNDSENGPEPNKLCQLLCDPLVKWDADNPLTIECYLNQCEAQLINATTMKSQVNSLKSHLMVTLSTYKKMFVMVESCGTSENTSNLYDHSANTVVDSQATVDEPDTVSNSWSQDSARCDSALVLPILRDSFTELKLDSHTNGDNSGQLGAMLVLRRGRCRKLEEEFSQLKQLALCRTENIRALRDAVCERIKLDQFDFETWRQNFLKWQTKRHFRLSDLFKAVLPVDTSSAQRSPGTTFSTDVSIYSEDGERYTNDCSMSSDIAIASPTPTDKISLSPNKSVAFGSGKQRLKSATSLEHLGVADKQEPSLNIELTCSQFVQGVHRHRPDFRGSDCVSLRAAFAEIDKNRKGRITIKQLMDALQPERQRQEIPVSQLIQNAIEAETKKCRCKTKFVPVKVDENRYRFGPSSQLYLVRFLNSITMVRVGGGWQNLTEFLATRDPCRARNKPPTPDSPSLSSMGTHRVSPAQSVTLSRSSPNSNLGSMRLTTVSRTSTESNGASNTTPAKLTAHGTQKQAPKAIPTTNKQTQGKNAKSTGKSNLKDGLENGKSH